MRWSLGVGSQEAARAKNALRRIRDVCARASKGDLEARIVGMSGDPDLAELADAINQLLDLVDAFVREASASLQFASGDRFFRLIIPTGMLGSFGAASETINTAMAKMSRNYSELEGGRKVQQRLATQLRDVAGSVSSAVTKLHASAEELLAGAEESSASATQTTRMAELTNEGIRSVSRETTILADLSGKILLSANESRMVVEQAVARSLDTTEAMIGLSAGVENISNFVALIRGIARQTNLLALNAAVEAARAGDAGRGFAVVAEEVRTLADQTAKATEEIRAQIESIGALTAKAAASIQSVRQAIEQTSSVAQQIDEMAKKQRAASAEIKNSVHQIADEATSICESVGSISSMSNSTGTAAEQVAHEARDLSLLADQLTEHAEKLLQETP